MQLTRASDVAVGFIYTEQLWLLNTNRRHWNCGYSQFHFTANVFLALEARSVAQR